MSKGQLFERLRREVRGEVLSDPLSRGLYSCDASFYQIEPLGVLIPQDESDVEAALAIARQMGVPVIARGAGTSQCGQVLGRALIIDTSKHLDRLLDLDAPNRTVTVQPGIVVDRLNTLLRPSGLFFPVDPATSSRATIGGMAGNNSSGSRSVRYGIMADNVQAIEAVLADGQRARFSEIPEDLQELQPGGTPRLLQLANRLRQLHAREKEELDRRVPKVMRHVAGYNLHRLSQGRCNLAEMLVGSEGTLAFFTRLQLALQPIPAHRVLGVCNFPSFYSAMQATAGLVELGASAVELFDRSVIELAQASPLFRDSARRFVKGDPQALLLVEFTGSEHGALLKKLDALEQALGDLGFAGAVVRAEDTAFQNEIWTVRKSGLNLLMSMSGPAKPVAFIEDCSVPLQHLAEYSDCLVQIFQRHKVKGTFYGHASVGCLHVRPLLDLKQKAAVKALRAIAEETHELVHRFKGSHSGEHGDGIVRSEFIEPMLGKRLAAAFREVKECFDPHGLFNPGRIVHPPRMDDRSLFRYPPGYGLSQPIRTALDWSDQGGLLGAVEMCNNNGACRKRGAEVMCPSYRATRNEHDLTRGRANALRLALTGQLGPDAFTSQEMHRTLDLCISCKACRRECPMGVDMSRMKIEFLDRFRQRHGIPLRDRLVAYLPRYAPLASKMGWLLNLRNRSGALSWLGERLAGISARRTLPRWQAVRLPDEGQGAHQEGRLPVLLLPDTFNTYFDPENLSAARRVLQAAGCSVMVAKPAGERPLCCGRTFLSMGLVGQARREAERTLAFLKPWAEKGIPIVGLEPSCLLTLRDEIPALLPGKEAKRVAEQALLFEEYLCSRSESGQIALDLDRLPVSKLLIHGHCHQKAFGAMPALLNTLRMIPDLDVQPIESTCCGMAGSFGYDADHYEVSMKIAELSLLPAVRQADHDTWIAADGFSCRHQIRHGSGRPSFHAARILAAAL